LEPGEEATQEISEALSKLDIEPLEVGLDLRALVEKEEGTVLEPETLDIDMDEYRADLESAAAGAFNLGVNAGVLTDETREPLLSKAYTDALAVGIEAGVYEPEVLDNLLAEADSDVRALAAQLDDDALPEELQGVEAEQAPAPEPSEETEEEAEEGEEQEAEGEEEEAGDDDDGDTEEDVSEGHGQPVLRRAPKPENRKLFNLLRNTTTQGEEQWSTCTQHSYCTTPEKRSQKTE